MLTYFEDNFHNIHNLFHDVNPSIFYPFIRKVKPHQRFQVFRGNPRVTIQMQTIVQCFHEVLFKVVLTFSLWMKPYCVIVQMKAIEQFFYLVLFIMLCKVVLTFKSGDETLVCDHSYKSY